MSYKSCFKESLEDDMAEFGEILYNGEIQSYELSRLEWDKEEIVLSGWIKLKNEDIKRANGLFKNFKLSDTKNQKLFIFYVLQYIPDMDDIKNPPDGYAKINLDFICTLKNNDFSFEFGWREL